MYTFTVSKAAKELGCHPETVRRLERRGILKAKRDYRNFRVFELADIMRVKKEREMLN
jgi:DNA-binding transcriptional MerR regulator